MASMARSSEVLAAVIAMRVDEIWIWRGFWRQESRGVELRRWEV
jgi:hypothetical protein